MKKFSVFFLFLPFLFSCASSGSKVLPPQEETETVANVEPQTITPGVNGTDSEVDAFGVPPAASSLKTTRTSIYIMGEGKANAETMALFLIRTNPHADIDFVRILTGHYIKESAYEGINHDVAFSQMCLETGFLAYGGLVQPDWNNFCGLGAIGPDEPGLVFADPQTGVRAHIQHLKAYATEEPLKGDLVDPRYRFVRKGSSPAIDGLSGVWATDRHYAIKIRAILQRLYDFSL